MTTKMLELKRLRKLLDDYYTALEYASAGKSYMIGTRNLTRYDLAEIRKTIEWLENKIDSLETGIGSRAFVVPRRR